MLLYKTIIFLKRLKFEIMITESKNTSMQSHREWLAQYPQMLFFITLEQIVNTNELKVMS